MPKNHHDRNLDLYNNIQISFNRFQVYFIKNIWILLQTCATLLNSEKKVYD